MKPVQLVFAALLGLMACGAPAEIQEKHFAAQGSGLICDRLKECARGEYLREYYGHSDCAAHWEIVLEDYIDVADDLDCDYSSEGAARAYNDLSDMSCENFYEGDYIEDFDKIWDDCALSFF